MRIFLIFLLVGFGINGNTQKGLAGLYNRPDSKIWINSDSTFKCLFSVDTYRGWVKGVWILKGKKIFLQPKPIFDTLNILDSSSKTKDSLILSRDEKPERLKELMKREISIFQWEQNQTLCPTVMYYKKDRLYVLKNGKRQKKKIANGYYIETFDPWYTKQNN